VPLNISAVIVSALLGLAFFLRRRREAERADLDRQGVMLVLALVGTYFVSFLPFFVTARYRAPMVPFLLLLSAFALRELWSMARAQRYVSLTATVAAVALAYTLHVQGSAGPSAAPVTEPRNAAADLAARGARLASTGRLEEAEAALREAVATDPTHAMARNNLGLLLQLDGRSEEAIEHLRAAIEIDERDHRPHQNLALASLATGDLDAALEHFARAAELAPLDPGLPLEAGRALLERGHPHLAAEPLGRARDLVELGQLAEGVAALEEADRLAPGNERIQGALGDARRAAGIAN
jgi:tetratricopeptide (TPR) repeat protein